jgi:hypothetical protein
VQEPRSRRGTQSQAQRTARCHRAGSESHLEAHRAPAQSVARGGEIGIAVGKIIGRRKVGKHFDITITGDSLSFTRDHAAIAKEAALDGFYVLRTNVPADDLAADDTVRAYKSLACVERAFRSLKTVDLDVRPIYHHVSPRVRGHAARQARHRGTSVPWPPASSRRLLDSFSNACSSPHHFSWMVKCLKTSFSIFQVPTKSFSTVKASPALTVTGWPPSGVITISPWIMCTNSGAA